MNDNVYKNSKIYKLISNKTELIYIGSTYDKLCKRKQNHISKYKYYLKHNKHYVSSCELLKLGDVDIILIENYSCNNRDELRARERHHIELNKNICVNIERPYISDEEKKEYFEKYRIDNNDILKENQKNIYNNNKDKILEKHKLHYEKMEKVKCDVCNIEFKKKWKIQHEKTKSHINKLT